MYCPFKFHPFASYVKLGKYSYNHSAFQVIPKFYRVKSFRWGSWSSKYHSTSHQPQQHQAYDEPMAWFNRNEAYVFDDDLEETDEDFLRAMALVHSRGYAVVKMAHFPNIGRNPLQTKQSVEIQTQLGDERLSSFGRPGVALNSPPMSTASSGTPVERRLDVSPMEVEDSSSPSTSATLTTPPVPRKEKWTPAKKIEAPFTPRQFTGKKSFMGKNVKGAARKPVDSTPPGNPPVPNIFGAAVPTQSTSPPVNAASTPRQGRKRRLNRSQRREKRERKVAAAQQQEAEGGEDVAAVVGEEEEEEQCQGEEEEEGEAEVAVADPPAIPKKKVKRPDARVVIQKRQQDDKDVFNQLVDKYKASGEYQFLLQQSKFATEEAIRDRKAARGAARGGRGRGRGRIVRPSTSTQPIDYRDLPHSDPQWKLENDAKYAEMERIQHLQMEAARREYDSTTQFFSAPVPPRLQFTGKNIDTKIAATLDANRRNPIMNRSIMPAVSSTLPQPIQPATAPVQLPAYPPLTPEDLRRYADQLEKGDLFAL